MATYTQGYQPYMPDWQPFTPDYKFLSDVLEIKTNRYNTNYKALNDLYSKVVYSDLSRKDTQEMRNQYAEILGKELQMVSGMDLSVAQNVDAAKQLFKPFFEEDLIVKDLVYTKQYQNEMQYANMLMNSPDKDQREMYWQTGVKALEYQIEDFKNASKDKALSMGTPRYVADADLYQKSIDFLKASGLDVTQEYVDETGFWIVKDKNGNLITEQAFQMAQRALSDDPLVQQAYYADAYVKSRDFAKAGMDAGQFENVDEGQAAWATETIKTIETQLAARSIQQQEKVQQLKNANINWEQYVKEQGIIPGSDEEKMLIAEKGSLEAALQGLDATEQALKNSQGSPDQSTQGLLNRAYNLLMGYNLQNDLSAAAISYSNINRSRELKVNDYKKQELQFKYDMAKISQQHQNQLDLEDEKHKNRLELEDYKNRLANPIGSFLSTLFSGTDNTKQGTEQVLIDPQTGKAVDPETADYVQLVNAKIEQLREDVTNQQVDVSLKALEMLENNPNNFYTVNDKIQGDLPTIRRELLKPENAGIADSLYKKMANQFRNSDELLRKNPNFVKGNLGVQYQQMAEEFNKITAKRLQFDNAITMGYDVMLQNFTTALSTDLTKEIKKVKEELRSGAPNIFTKNKSTGSVEFMTEDEFINAYVAKARTGKIAGEDFTVTHTKYITDKGMVKVAGGEYDYPKRRVTEFSVDKAIKWAKESYANQKTVINSTLNGTLETIAEQEGAKTNPQVRMFQPWDPNQYMRGTSMEEMQTGDALKSPYYSVQINPPLMTKDGKQASAISELVTQVRQTPNQEIMFHRGDIGLKAPGDVNMNASDAKARQIYDLWIQELSRFTDPKASKTNMPSATIGYAPSYGPTGKATLGKDEAAYVISFSPDWLKSLQGTANKPGVLTEKELNDFTTITISFPQEKDMNSRKAGQYNFSAVRNEVLYSPQKQMVQTIDSGGQIRVYPSADGSFIMETTPLQYNPSTGNFDPISPIRVNISQIQAEANETIGFLDNIVSEEILKLNYIANQNNSDQQANKKSKIKK
jgi:hypothetical protein